MENYEEPLASLVFDDQTSHHRLISQTYEADDDVRAYTSSHETKQIELD